MTEGIYVDSDVLLKMCVYAAAAELVQVASANATEPAILLFAKFALRSRIDRARNINDKAAARKTLEVALSKVRQLEPTTEEIEKAAEFEERATAAGLSFDVGESQLMSVMQSRHAVALLTGDKRAIKAISVLFRDEMVERVACLEQVVATIIAQFGLERFRDRVCSERGCDKAITASFSCSSSSLSSDEVLIGLRSYIKSLRNGTGNVLISSDDLSAIVS
ncbi:hypothetical protein [Bradyrhizobium centrosematis]|uniref:hypothetical protein n=1 Tax=Bradyrhizobium centrosematis TaxID=1300039 RepID=UPI002168E7AD|nr:hypothetical protein [Bradyrhizobium centrosematis]MCS3761591.1 hypothetical protein [Bradyrhizobium centrosematis]MCS3774259.1 hypothetical protein [Bradyrhizobium centrosematis]